MEVAIVFGLIHIAAAIAVLNGLNVPIGQGNIAVQAIESIARQPEAADEIRSAMFIGLATSETSAIYGFVIAIIMLFANPLVDRIISLLS